MFGELLRMTLKFAHSERRDKRFVRSQRDDLTAKVTQSANMAESTPFPQNLRAARMAKGWSLETLAAAAETSKGYLSDLERGVRPMPPGAKLETLAAALGVTVAALAGQNSEADDRIRRTVPLVGYVGAGDAAHYYDVGQGELDRVDAPEGANDNTVAAKIQGTSLGPLLDGWLVFWDEVRNPVTTDLYGELCVVGLLDQRILVKQIRPAGAPGRYHLISNNEAPMLDVEVAWAAKITEMRPR